MYQNPNRLFNPVFAGCLLLSATGPAAAATVAAAAAQASIDWSTFSVQLYAQNGGSVPTLSWSDQGDESWTSVNATDTSDTAADWITGTYVNHGLAAPTHATAETESADPQWSGTISADTSVEIGVLSADAWRHGTLTIGGLAPNEQGLVVIAADYAWSVEADDLGGGVNLAEAYAGAEFYTWDQNGNLVADSWSEGWASLTNAPQDSASETDTLAVALIVEAGDVFDFAAWAYADTEASLVPNPAGVVPIPASLWLFGSALSGAATLTRRRKTGAKSAPDKT